MPVVSDTSPISNLAVIGRLDLLQLQFGEVRIPTAVHRELLRLSHPAGYHAIRAALNRGWIVTQSIGNRALAAAYEARLDPGESEAIVLAMELSAGLILVDEKDARSIAAEAGLVVTGVLGVLLRAKREGQIGAIGAELRALRTEAGFYISARLEGEILRVAGER